MSCGQICCLGCIHGGFWPSPIVLQVFVYVRPVVHGYRFLDVPVRTSLGEILVRRMPGDLRQSEVLGSRGGLVFSMSPTWPAGSNGDEQLGSDSSRILVLQRVIFLSKASLKKGRLNSGSWRLFVLLSQDKHDQETDTPVLDLWLRSLQATAMQGFHMQLEEPEKVCCSDQRNELVDKLQKHVNEGTQFVLLLTPSNDCWKVYRLFKEAVCCDRALPSQVVKSDTIRKRQSTGSILARVVQQMNAKSNGPLWHVMTMEPKFEAFFEDQSNPFMILGINVYRTAGGTLWLGLVATLNKACSQFFSMAQDVPEDVSVVLQRLFRDALLAFADCNSQQLPKKIIVYRSFVSLDERSTVKAVEVEALKKVMAVASPKAEGSEKAAYTPELTFITVAKKDDMRIFSPRPDISNIGNPESGTVVDDWRLSCGAFPCFYAINQTNAKGTAVPSHYSVIAKPESVSMDFIQKLTYKLSLLYYNSNSAVRYPAPVMYARRLTSFVGNTLRRAPNAELTRQLFYL